MKKSLVLKVVGSLFLFSNVAAAQDGVPSDYRKQAAKVIVDRTNYKIRDAQISKPSSMWGGLLAGGNVPGICAVIFRDNPFGSVVRDVWQVTFSGGKVAAASTANISCNDTSKFHEVLGR